MQLILHGHHFSGPPSTPSTVAAAITDSTPVVTKDRSICILPECTRPKYVDHGTGVAYDYCGKTHSLEGQRRGIRRKQKKIRAKKMFKRVTLMNFV